MSDLARGVNACVRSARANGTGGLAQKYAEGTSQFSLHGAVLPLNLPSGKVGAVVFEQQADTAVL